MVECHVGNRKVPDLRFDSQTCNASLCSQQDTQRFFPFGAKRLTRFGDPARPNANSFSNEA